MLKNRNSMKPFRKLDLWLLVGSLDHFGIRDVVDLLAPVVDHDSAASFAQGNAVACSAKVQDLIFVSCLRLINSKD
jgi:hypothetical protein